MKIDREVVLAALLGAFLATITGVFTSSVRSGPILWTSLASLAEYTVVLALGWIVYPIFVPRPFSVAKVLTILGFGAIYLLIGMVFFRLKASTGVDAEPASLFNWIFAGSAVVGLRSKVASNDQPSVQNPSS